MSRYLIVLVFLLVLASPAYAQISNPHMVDYLKAEVIQSGQIETSGNVLKTEFILSIPQEDEYQKIDSITVNVPYIFYTDELENRNIKIVWDKPKAVNYFEVKTVVSIKRRNSATVENLKQFIEPTSLIESNDSEISTFAQTFQGNEFERISSMAKWIADNTVYDNTYSAVNMSAKWVFENRKGVCDEFSVLLIALARSSGYYSKYIAGYAYGSNDSMEEFIPHGWTEIDDVVADPTWAQAGFLDATHIKFAELSDASYTQASVVSSGVGDFRVDLGDIKAQINVLEYTQNPLVRISSSPLDDVVSDGYAVIKTAFTSDRCLLTKMKVQSCVNDKGTEMFTPLEPEKTIYFCNTGNVFSILKLNSKGDVMTSYKCPVTVYPYAGLSETVPVVISLLNQGDITLSVDKTVLIPNEKFSAESKNAYLFTDYGDYGYNKVELKAPRNSFKIYAYKSGALASQDMKVVSEKPFDAYLILNQSKAEVHVESLKGTQQITAKMNNETQTKSVSGKDIFVFTAKSDVVQVVVSSGDFSITLSKTVEKSIGNPNNFLSSFISGIRNFFRGMFG